MANTPNLGLHQWAAGDSFLREEFNQDFSKIDTAVDKAMGVVKLMELVTTATVSRLDIDMSGIDLMAYRQIEIELRGVGTVANGSAHMRLNDVLGTDGVSYYMYQSANGNSYATNTFAGLTLGTESGKAVSNRVTLYGGATLISGRYQTFGDNTDVRVVATAASGVTATNLRTANIVVNSGALKVGAQLTIYGVRR